jgi:hypothetical protein
MPKPKEYTLYNNFVETAVERMIATFWSKLKINQTGDHNKDYGNHCLTLNFPPPQQLQQQSTKCTGEMVAPLNGGYTRLAAWKENFDFIPGTKSETLPNGTGSFGIVKDYCNFPEETKNPPKNHSEEMLDFIEDFRKVLIEQRRELNKKNTGFIRINILKGARTINHTDTLRSTMMNNYFMFFPPKKCSDWTRSTLDFSLKVCLWPTFKTSFVAFRDEIVIPFSYMECPEGDRKFSFSKESKRGGYLQMIRRNASGSVKWLIAPPHCLHELKPMKKMRKGLAVAGIVDGKLRVVTDKYTVINSWSEVDTMSFDDLFEMDGNTVDYVPRKLYSHFDIPYKIYPLKGWEHIHGVEYSSEVWKSDNNAIRLHAFFRNICTVAVSVQLHPYQKWTTSM